MRGPRAKKHAPLVEGGIERKYVLRVDVVRHLPPPPGLDQQFHVLLLARILLLEALDKGIEPTHHPRHGQVGAPNVRGVWIAVDVLAGDNRIRERRYARPARARPRGPAVGLEAQVAPVKAEVDPRSQAHRTRAPVPARAALFALKLRERRSRHHPAGGCAHGRAGKRLMCMLRVLERSAPATGGGRGRRLGARVLACEVRSVNARVDERERVRVSGGSTDSTEISNFDPRISSQIGGGGNSQRGKGTYERTAEREGCCWPPYRPEFKYEARRRWPSISNSRIPDRESEKKEHATPSSRHRDDQNPIQTSLTRASARASAGRRCAAFSACACPGRLTERRRRRPKSEVRRPKSEDRRPKTEVRSPKTDATAFPRTTPG